VFEIVTMVKLFPKITKIIN